MGILTLQLSEVLYKFFYKPRVFRTFQLFISLFAYVVLILALLLPVTISSLTSREGFKVSNYWFLSAT